MILSRKSIYVHSVVKSAMLFNVLVAVLPRDTSPSCHAVLPRHPAMLSSPSCIAILHRYRRHANSIAVLPCCPAMLSCHAVLPCRQHRLPRDTSPTSHANDINIPLPMLYICFSTNYKPFAMLLPLCGLVLLFCCIVLVVVFNCASIAPLAISQSQRQGDTAKPTARRHSRTDGEGHSMAYSKGVR